ncbi:hypothetical protein ACKKBG_A22985 [Auxenochlorella protothecoides x Auxenochlorella symbiontica]|uniref:SAP domain-containing protein n=2 Tax=Auxenochlorella protothecoides TaxID=3075 RepID=A0A087SN72_AUXPR|nr:hypothetical protein F751_4446 [Auxenochlorella protothecoides]KFM27176.1 hypothetical protein F751_4446 [Auxenochlorella protothecoides]RMZ57101.1 hypothetical protein APUTEX25_002333 [Auxenochlorella protothecoides]|eukprot:RMZ57101.1 hypothetical protein APUTEX25_002333 [Auxenochlorella protothecoides]
MSQVAGFLADLPSRGHFTRTKPGPTFLSPATPYIASHDTDPPASQVIKSDPTSILVRALQSRKEEAKRKQGGKAAADKGKRQLDDGPDAPGRGAKRAHEGAEGAGPSASRAAGGSPLFQPSTVTPVGGLPSPSEAKFSRLALQAWTLRQLQTLLKAWALPSSGKKDDLVARILRAQAAAGDGG